MLNVSAVLRSSAVTAFGGENPGSWNSAHGSRGCGQDDLQGTGGDGLSCCFAAD